MMTLSHGVQNINYRQYRLEVRYQGRGWKVFIYPPGAQGPSYAAPFVKQVDEKRKDRSVSRVSSREPLDRAVFFPYPKYGIVEQPISDQSYRFRCRIR